MADRQLIIFVKAPRPGEVKSRLARSIGTTKACRAYVLLVEFLLKNLARLTGVQLRHAPDDAAEEMKPWLQPGWTTHPQGEGDLGVRLARAFSEAFQDGASQVLAIGSDCPEVSSSDIKDAFRQLNTHDIAVGPAADGGYWMIGLKQFHESLFQSIPWSTPEVLGQTLARAKSLGLKIYLSRILVDIDTAKEWNEFKRDHPEWVARE